MGRYNGPSKLFKIMELIVNFANIHLPKRIDTPFESTVESCAPTTNKEQKGGSLTVLRRVMTEGTKIREMCSKIIIPKNLQGESNLGDVHIFSPLPLAQGQGPT